MLVALSDSTEIAGTESRSEGQCWFAGRGDWGGRGEACGYGWQGCAGGGGCEERV